MVRLTKQQIQTALKEKGLTQKLVGVIAKTTEEHISMVIAGTHKSKPILELLGKLLGYGEPIELIPQEKK